MKKLLLMSAILALSLSATANAGAILQATNVSTNMGEWSSSWLANNAINQSGLSTGYTSGVTDFDTYTASATAQVTSGDTWFSSPGLSSGNFDLDLGSVNTIGSMALWNESQGIGQGVNSFNLFSDINSSFSSATLLGSFNAFEGSIFAQIFNFVETEAQFIRLEILSNHGASCCTGIMEIAFEEGSSVSEVPVPAAVWLMGSGLLGLMGFNRKAKKLAA